jgi:hypothetical protein
MHSMTLAALGWGCWWLALLLERYVPDLSPGFLPVAIAGCTFAAGGIALALLTIRATRSWLPFSMVALFANASLFALPWIVRGLELQAR